MEHLLDVRDLRVYFESRGASKKRDVGMLRAVDGVSFRVGRGRTLGIVGESGCGKSVACLSILRLVQSPPGVYAGGEILFDGEDTLKMSKHQLRVLRGSRISMIFQEPMAALNPVFTVGQQLNEAIRLHQSVSKSEATALAIDLLRQVRIPDAKRVFNSYAFALSGGLRQRVMIAMALSCKPDLLIADEPTTALDVTIQSKIMALLRKLQEETGMATILVSHDLSLVSGNVDDIMVMYSGRVCEYAPVTALVENPMHPYTLGLIASRPSGADKKGRLHAIPGTVPSLKDRPEGCPFHTRCKLSQERCQKELPPNVVMPGEHMVSCWRFEGAGA
jgi:peptide/nickel transport system ATP-binding protein/oligopeptide transport system ATP-binding protein